MSKIMLFIYIALFFPQGDTISRADTTTKKLLYLEIEAKDDRLKVYDKLDDTLLLLQKNMVVTDSLFNEFKKDTLIIKRNGKEK